MTERPSGDIGVEQVNEFMVESLVMMFVRRVLTGYLNLDSL